MPDHDYCTDKQVIPIRKAIEIPIIDPSIDLKLKLRAKTKVSAMASRPRKPQPVPQRMPTPAIEAPALTVTNFEPPKRKINLDDYRQRSTETRTHVDPILEAKRKALLRQELKKKALMQEAEPKIEQVPLLTILPLAAFTGAHEQEVTKILNPDFEEIVMVSIGCNTNFGADGTIPSLASYQTKVSDRKLPKSSLFSSIQDTIRKKSSTSHTEVGVETPAEGTTAPSKTPDNPEESKSQTQHGEDKVIMHLPKDRKRPEMVSIGVQATDPNDEYPVLCEEHVDDEYETTHKRRHYRRHRYSSTSSQQSSSPDETHHRHKRHKKYDNSRSSSQRSSSYSSSRSPEDSLDCRYRRGRYYDAGKDSFVPKEEQQPKNAAIYAEKRNVVYVGKLEDDLTRDDLKFKFTSYGPIKEVSIHVKKDE